ncbi:hypothetical protein BDN72DRAFT_926148 [Pluteus cervinus]|uniref:Uncharacterized protein n=1 Tax=Pluteus cervinus TaxID=181527 RepID=A0ACD3B5C4_9AGAR|nr:hypothetical protein BDN72DRAFT_926148 [Pluteus cervinus]
MVILDQFLSSFFLAVIYASVADAAPWPQHATHHTHRVRHYGRDVQVVTFHPPNTFQVSGLDQPAGTSSLTGNGTIADAAISFVTSQIGVGANEVAYKSGYNRDTEKFAWVKQAYDGIPFANAVANIAWKDGKVTTFGNSFVKPTTFANSTPTLSLESVVPQTENLLQAKLYDSEPTIEWVARPDGSAALAHVFQLRDDDTNAWMEAFVDAHSGDLLTVTDFVADATYTVVPVDRLSVLDGLVTLEDPENLQSSPLGWHDDGTVQFTNTSGNNVIAAKGTKGGAQESSDNLNFNFVFNTDNDPIDSENILAASTNAFYVANVVHDFAYLYGFTEQAFNFQQNNFGKGGQDGDRVLLSVQDKGGVNNANFASPPDGLNGICRMFIFTETNPRRDGAMEDDVVSHEMTHGITNRMTGGGTGRCLQALESGGLGEGWSDAVAGWIQSDAKVGDFIMGQYVTGSDAGIRTHPYSTNPKTNPLRYSSLKQLNEVHKIGEVWANMLHNVLAALVTDNGFNPNHLSDPTGSEGNIVFMQLLIDALPLQPCNPSFADARDSWIQADQNRYGGKHTCTFMRAFASRGLGINAGSDFNDDDTLPDGC